MKIRQVDFTALSTFIQHEIRIFLAFPVLSPDRARFTFVNAFMFCKNIKLSVTFLNFMTLCSFKRSTSIVKKLSLIHI